MDSGSHQKIGKMCLLQGLLQNEHQCLSSILWPKILFVFNLCLTIITKANVAL